MDEMQTLNLFKCLADRSRLAIMNNLIREPMYVELIAQRLALTPSTVSFHLKKLEEAGLVASRKEQYYVVYQASKELLGATLGSLVASWEGADSAEAAREAAYRQKVLDSFFQYGKLKSIPVQQKKARIVLEEMLKSFAPGRIYPEKEVNLILAEYYDDFCTLRRGMICEGLMTRDHNMYKLKQPKAPDSGTD